MWIPNSALTISSKDRSQKAPRCPRSVALPTLTRSVPRFFAFLGALSTALSSIDKPQRKSD